MSEQDSTAQVEYRPIPDFPGYKVGSDGTVWTCRMTRAGMTDTWRMMNGENRVRPSGNSYLYYTLRNNNKPHLFGGHQLVLMAFVGPMPEGLCCCHKNDIGTDNRLENLRWGTMKENIEDRGKNGLTKKGDQHYLAKLSEGDAARIMEMIVAGMTNKEIARMFPVGENNISSIRNGRSWRWLWGEKYRLIPSLKCRRGD